MEKRSDRDPSSGLENGERAGDARQSEVTAILGRASTDPRAVFDELLPYVYDELHRLAHWQLGGEWRQRTLDTTGLVHEAYLKLVDHSAVPVKSRAYFFGAAARAMRQVLVDAARRRNRNKRGGGIRPESLDEEVHSIEALATNLVDLDDALEELAGTFPRPAQVVECRFFGGLSVEETAAALDISPRSVKRDWSLARAWLFRHINGDSPAEPTLEGSKD
ncbi:MAG: sigma-70 family RNA polymerase sigma factor [Thermoanaerobaculia bacterium]|nr:sigma-70 family RNA polymerase sigma factor [Thermoanaerobaculia bacterium]